ncbi:hypothetical protein ACFQGT_10130 [Natrialbaceae archaeon GCM10025810]|uniref:hypothetical protein n=1 Tax=Halovalidus salilacus TaxID=3075124 RepID=UPI0036109318
MNDANPSVTAAESSDSTSESRPRTAAICESCDRIFAAEVHRDGTVRPLGTTRNCVCGDGDLRPLRRAAPP